MTESRVSRLDHFAIVLTFTLTITEVYGFTAQKKQRGELSHTRRVQGSSTNTSRRRRQRWQPVLSGIHRTTAEDAVGPRCISLSRSRNPCPRAACVSKRYKLIRESAAKGHRSVPWAGFRQPAREKKPCHFGPDELPRVIIIVDPLARRVRETEAHVMLLVEGGERDKVATATANQPLVPACANGRLNSRTTRG